METTKQQALIRARVLLKAAGVEYIIVTPEGVQHVHGELVLAPKKESHKSRGIKKYDYTGIYKPVFATMQAGDVREFSVPIGAPIVLSDLAKALSGAAVHAWGAGNAIVSSNNEKQVVEVLRVV